MTASVTPFEPRDLFNEQRVESIDLRSGAASAICAVKTALASEDGYQSQLWELPLDAVVALSASGGSAEATGAVASHAGAATAPRQLTFTAGHQTRPRCAPNDGRIAFLSDRHGGTPQVYLLDGHGAEAKQLTRFEAAVIDLVWRPGGRQMALICAMNVDPDQQAEGAAAVDPTRAAAPSSAPEVVWRLPYKMDGSGYILDERLHIVLLDVASGATTLLTRGDYDVGHVCWSADGERLAFTRSREEESQTHCKDVWVLDIGPHDRPFPPMRRLTTTVATAAWPAWSPDGATIAFMGAEDGGDPIMHLWQVEVGSGVVRGVGDPRADDAAELVSGPLYWDADSRRLRAIQAWRGLQRIVCIDVGSGEVTPLFTPETGHVTLMAAQDLIVYVEEGIDHPIEVHSCDLDGRHCRPLTDFNAWWRQRLPMQVEYRTFQLPDGEGGHEPVDGWLMTPAGQPRCRPLLVDVHGGPASYVMLQFATSLYWQVLVSQGWAVLALNAVGSASYGRRFSERLRRRWGQLDLPQHRAAVAALRNEGLADARVAIAGSSYGGYFSAYATGHCDEFRAAVVSAPVGNLETHYGTSDSGYYADPFSMEGRPETSRELMVALSPMAHIGKSRTPTLFLQGKEDERCPKCQSEEMFVKLRRAGTTAAMVLYPGGDHHTLGKGRPSHRLDGHGRIVQWLQQWIKVASPRDE